MYLSDLKINQNFSYKGKSIVYFVADIVYNVDCFHNYTIYYRRVNSFTFYKWTSNQIDKEIRLS